MAWGAWCAVAGVALSGCGPEGGCLSTCFDSSITTFVPPINQPGSYVIDVGGSICEVELPAQTGTCRDPNTWLTIEQFAVTQLRGTHPLSSSVAVAVERDGASVLSTSVAASSRERVESCTGRCSAATYEVPVPAELVRPIWGPCDRAALDGAYDLAEQRIDGDCPELDSDDRLILSGGVPLLGDTGCDGEIEAFDAARCSLISTAACGASPVDFDWRLEVTDVAGDGSRLLGRTRLEMRAPIACSGTFLVDLRRAD